MKKNYKRIGSVLLVLAMLLACMPAVFAAEGDVTIYLKPSAKWADGSPRYAVYYFNGSSNGWVDMSASGDGLYSANVPAGNTIIICRMDPNAPENNWGNKWNQTGDLTLPSGGNNCFYAPDTWNGAGNENWGSKEVAPEVTEPVFTAYTVAGEAGLCGDGWDPASNAMTETETGIWSITFSNIAAGSYEFKVTDGTWNNSWGVDGGQTNMTVSVTVLSDVTITFNADTKAIDVATVPAATQPEETQPEVTQPEETQPEVTQPEETQPEVTQPEETQPETPSVTYTVAGDEGLCGVSWKPEQNPMTLNADGLYEITFNDVAAGNYGFKITEGKWEPGHEWPSENYNLTVNSAGNVTILFNAETKEITVNVANAAPVEHTVQLHFLPEGSWGSTTNVWLWGLDGGDLPGYEAYHKNWPGKAIEANPEHEGWYDMTVVTDRAEGFNIIFNDGKHQTADLYSGLINADTELWFIGGTVYAAAPEAWTGVPTYTYTVHFENAGGWENVNAYGWVNDDQFLGGWTGKATTENKANPGWQDIKFTVPYNSVSLIFNGSGQQTADLTIASFDDARNVEVWVYSDNAVETFAPETWVEGPSGNTVTLHFMPPYTTWGENINAWLWAGAGDVPGYEAYHKNWPGKRVEADPEHPGWYTLEVTTELSSFNFIFNGRGRQTKDLSTGVITGDMELWIFGNAIYTSEPTTTPSTGDSTNVAAFGGLLVVSLLAMGAVLVLGKKKLA